MLWKTIGEVNIVLSEDLFLHKENEEKVSAILDSVPDTDIRIDGIKTLEEAIEEIKQLGENKIVEYLLG